MARFGAAARRRLTVAAAVATAAAALGSAEVLSRRADPDWNVLRPEADAAELSFTAIKIPVVADGSRRLDKPKAPGTFRILCLGGSMTAGYPFPGEGWPEHLKAALPSSWEVLNLGRGGYGSARDRIVLEQALRVAAPDLVVAFEGHNEVAERLILDATRATPLRRLAAAARLALYRTAAGTRLIRRGGPAFRGWIARRWGRRCAEERLAVFGGPTALTDLSAPPGSADAPETADALSANLEAMARLCRINGVPLILGVPPTDERHEIPVENPWGKLLDPPGALEARAGAVAAFFAARAAESSGNCRAALAKLEAAARALDFPALHFLKARCLERGGKTAAARAEYAAWHSPEPTCGPGLRAAIRGVAAREKLPLVDADGAWRRSAPGGLPDSSLFVDDHHLSLEGYRRLAALVAATVSADLKLPPVRPASELAASPARRARPHFLLGHLYSIWSSDPDSSLGFDRAFHRRAVAEFVAALRGDPSLDDADPGPDAVATTSEVNLAIADERLGRRKRALVHLRRAFALRPRASAAEAAYDLARADDKLALADFIPAPVADFAPFFGIRGKTLIGAWTNPRAGILVRLPDRPRRAAIVLSAVPAMLRHGPVGVTAYLGSRRVGAARWTRPGRTALEVGTLGGGGLGVIELRFDKWIIPAAEGLSPDVEPLGGLIEEARFL